MRTKRVHTRSSSIPETVSDARRRCVNPDCSEEFVPLRPWHRYHTPRCRVRDWNRKQKSTPGRTPAKTTATSPRRYIIHCVVELK